MLNRERERERDDVTTRAIFDKKIFLSSLVHRMGVCVLCGGD